MKTEWRGWCMRTVQQAKRQHKRQHKRQYKKQRRAAMARCMPTDAPKGQASGQFTYTHMPSQAQELMLLCQVLLG